MKRPLKFMAFRESLAVIVDSEKGNILDLRLESIKRALNFRFLKSSFLCRNKRFVRSIRQWTGQSIGEEARFGLSAPNRLITLNFRA